MTFDTTPGRRAPHLLPRTDRAPYPAALVLALAVALVASLVGPGISPAAASAPAPTRACPATYTATAAFADVSTAHTHAASVTCLASWGVVSPGDGPYRPDATATRAEFAAALHATLVAVGRAPTPATPAFLDVPTDHPDRAAIGALAGAGIVAGTTATTFVPDGAVTRGQLATLLVRADGRVFGRQRPLGPTFPDTRGSTHEDAVRRLVGTGVTQGYADGSYRPGASMTRGQLATFLVRWLDLLVVEASAPAPLGDVDRLRMRRLDAPARSVVEDAEGRWVATFTDGARTVTLAGPARRFEEATATHGVTSTTWVRLLPAPFDGRVDERWLRQARTDRSADVLATSLQYLAGAPDVRNAAGVLVAGDAAYGPLLANGDRSPGSDWHDYQQVVATYGTSRVSPRPERDRSVDCSGFVRLLFGVRFGLPLGRQPDGGASLPRSSQQQATDAPGVVPIANLGTQVTAFESLQPGDLVFFDATVDPANTIDHVGVYLGRDDAGRHRFVSSRRSIDGPTLGDFRGASLLDGTGLYARTFRSTRRL
ncbi:S-layer homology domain-containing protein [Egicoccus halophilus]|uniref:Cell wall-associated hydrolase, NlpC family n=1 Tax=Egicoccus halophilus TaxID=1670830 RepID=A0A8J3AB16_9ACTN|nr:S-layer homology domain-containing protein [Egicoccus halophilus]GGI02531.1 hypothetical protein GCM10011354_00670 [Egicoccus halophilus]